MLRKAVLTCMTVVTGIGSTLATGTVVGGLAAWVMSSQQVAATEYEITASNDPNLKNANKSSDKVTLKLESGALYAETNGATRLAPGFGTLIIEEATLTSLLVNNYIYQFKAVVKGSGDLSFTGTDEGSCDGINFIFTGNMQDYTGNMFIADDKTGSFTFNISSSTKGTGYGTIIAKNANSSVTLSAYNVNNSLIETGTITLKRDGIININEDITLKAVTAITNSTTTHFHGALTLSHVIDNSGTLIFDGNIKLTKEMRSDIVAPETNGFASYKYQVVVGSGSIQLADGVKIYSDTDQPLFEQVGSDQTFTGSVDVKDGSLFYIVEENSSVNTSDQTGETGYVMTAAGSQLVVDDKNGSLSSGVTVDVGKGNRAEILYTSTASLANSALHHKSGYLDFTLDSGANYTIMGDVAINGRISVKDGAVLTVQGNSVLGSVGKLVLTGTEGSPATAKLSTKVDLTSDVDMKGNSVISGSTLNFATSSCVVSASGTNNTISSDLTGAHQLIFDIDENAELLVSGSVDHTATSKESFYKMGSGKLILQGKNTTNIAGQTAIYGGTLQLNSAASLNGGALVGTGALLSVNNGAAATVSKLDLSTGGALAVDATSSAVINELNGKGTITVADGGKLTLMKVDSADAITVSGVATAGTGFSKTGTGQLTLSVLRVDANGELLMNGHTGLSVSVFDFAPGATLVYSLGDVLSIGNLNADWTLTLDVNQVVSSLGEGNGVDTGITLRDGQSLDDLLGQIKVNGIDDYKLTLQDGRVWIAAEVELSPDWDPNWGLTGLAEAPAAADILRKVVDEDVVSLQLKATELAEGGTIDTLVAGGIVRQTEKQAGTQTGDSWIKVTGGTYQAIVGGNVNVGSEDAGAAHFVGDTHVQMHGGTTEFVIGGNMRDYGAPKFTGDTYVSIYQGATVNQSVVGGSTIYYGQPVEVNGNTNVFIYSVLTGAEEAPGFVLGGNYHESLGKMPHSKTKLSVTGDTNILVDLTDYKIEEGAPTDFTKHIVGGHYMTTTKYGATVGGTSRVSIVGQEGISFSGNIIGGTWTESNITQAESSSKKAGAQDTEVSISGDSVYNGRVVAGHLHHNLAGYSEVGGTAKLTISGGTFNNYVTGGSSVASLAGSKEGGAYIKAVDMTLNGGTFKAMVAGGSLVAADEDTAADGVVAGVKVDEVSMTLSGSQTSLVSACGGVLVENRGISSLAQLGDVTINLDGATVGTLYGGSYLNSIEGNCTVMQGDIVINLNSGSVTGALYAAGGAEKSENMTTASTTVNVGQGANLSGLSAIHGGYYKAAGTNSAGFVITGDATLSFTDAGEYTNTANLAAVDFNKVSVAADASATLKSLSTLAGSLTKSGAGQLKVSSAVALDSVSLQGGHLNLAGGITSAGLSVQAANGGTMAVGGNLTLSALKVNMPDLTEGTPLISLTGELSATDKVLKLELTDYDKIALGSYCLIEMGSLAEGVKLDDIDFAAAPDGMEYVLDLSGNSLMFHYRSKSQWTWQGSVDGETAVWSNDSDNGWKYEGDDVPDNITVYFDASGAAEAAGSGLVTIQGTVTPGNIEMNGGEYTFTADAQGGSIELPDAGTLKIGPAATLHMAMDNASLGGQTNLQGRLVLESANALGDSELQFNGGTLVYSKLPAGASGQTLSFTDLSAQSTLAEGYKGAVKIEVTDADNAITWNASGTALANNSGVSAVLNSGLVKSGAGQLDIIWQAAENDTYAGAISVQGGTLRYHNSTANLATLSGDIDVAKEAHAIFVSGKADTSAGLELSGDLTGAGVVEIGTADKDNGRYKISGDNSAFAGTLKLSGNGTHQNHNLTHFGSGKSFGGAGTTVEVNGRGLFFTDTNAPVKAVSDIVVIGNSAGNVLSGSMGQEIIFTGSWTVAEDAAFGATSQGPSATITAYLAGDLSGFKGTLRSLLKNTWVMGGEGVAGSGSLDMAAVTGNGKFRVQYGTETVLNTSIKDAVDLQQFGSGKLIIASENTTSGELTVDKGKEAQLGSATATGTWVGKELLGEGTFTLVNGTLKNLERKDAGATLAVATTTLQSRTRTSVAAGTTVTVDAASAALLDSIDLVAGSKLVTDGALIVGGAGTSLTMALTSDNFGTDLTDLSALIDAPSLTLASAEGVDIKLSQADLLDALREAGNEGDIYVKLVNGSLALAEGVDINNAIAANLLSYGLRAQVSEDGLQNGYVVINGDISGVYFTDDQQDASGNPAVVNVSDSRLAAFSGVVINAGDTLRVNLNSTDGSTSTIINNLNGQVDSVLDVVAGDVILRNVALETGLTDPDYKSMGADNTLEGDLRVAKGSTVSVQGVVDNNGVYSGSLTVLGTVTAASLSVESGALHLGGSGNTLENFSLASGATLTLASGKDMQWGQADINGNVTGADGATLAISGQAVVNGHAALQDLSVSLAKGAELEVNSDAYHQLSALNAAADSTLDGMGALINVGNYELAGTEPGIAPLSRTARAGVASSSFSGKLSGSFNELNIGSNHDFAFANATGSAGWNVNVQGSLTIDSTNGKAMELGRLAIERGGDLTLRFNSDLREGNNLHVLNLQSLDLASPDVAAQADTSLTLTLVSTGVAQLEAGRYILGELPGGISFDGLAYQATELELTDVSLTLLGSSFSRIDVENCKLIVADGQFILNLVKSETNAFEPVATETNSKAGANMLWSADTPEDGDLKDVYNTVNYMVADGKGSSAQKTLAAVAGAAATTMGTAFSGDVERQLRAIRNRTTTMGVNQCVINENMPYLNAWVNAEGNHAEMDADGLAPGYTLDNWGGTLGIDVDVTPSLTLGVAITAMYGDLTADSAETRAEGDLDTRYLSLFARYSRCAWTHTFIATMAQMDGSMDRTVTHDYGSYTAKGETEGSGFGLMYEVARTIALDEEGDAAAQLIANVSYRHVTVDGYQEKNTDAAVTFGKQSLDTLTLALGGRMQSVVAENMWYRTAIFEARALAKFDLGDRQSQADVSMLHSTGSGRIESAELGAFGVELGAGLSVPLGDEDSGTLFFDVSAELRSGYNNVNGTVGYRINF